MPLSPEQESIIRVWVGDNPTVPDLEDLYAQVGSWDEVVKLTIRRAISIAAAQPSSISVPGLSISFGQQLSYLRAILDDFYNSNGTGLDEDSTMGLRTGRIVRITSR